MANLHQKIIDAKGKFLKVISPIDWEPQFDDNPENDDDPVWYLRLQVQIENDEPFVHTFYYMNKDDAEYFLEGWKQLPETVQNSVKEADELIEKQVSLIEDMKEFVAECKEMIRTGQYYQKFPITDESTSELLDAPAPQNRVLH